MRNIKTREGFEFWDKLNALPRYAFLLSPSGTSVQKFEDKAMGNWIDVHEAQSVIDQAQERITELITSYKALGELYASTQEGFERMQAERDTLQLRLNATDQRIDELVSAVRSINRGRRHEVFVPGDDEPQYRQRKEWVDWVLSLCDEASTAQPEQHQPGPIDDWHMNPCKQGHRDVGAAGGVAHCYQCEEKIEAATTQEAFERWNATHPKQ